MRIPTATAGSKICLNHCTLFPSWSSGQEPSTTPNPSAAGVQAGPPLDKLLARLRADGRDGRGVREFVRLLRLPREHPADQVAQAIRLALAYGCLHADGVALCLHQLQHPSAAAPLAGI